MSTDIEDPESSAPNTLPRNSVEAHDQALAGNILFGEPFTWPPSRKIAADAMGLRWLAGPDAAANIKATGLYSGALRDVIIFAWLCSLKNASEVSGHGAWTIQRASHAPEDAFEVASTWAESKGLTGIDTPAFAEAYKVFMAVMLGVSLSEFEVELPKDSKQPEGAPSPNV